MIKRVLDRLSGVQSSGRGFKALCPAHPEFSPSLEVAEGDGGRVLLHCHAGCATEEVLRSLGMGWGDLMGDGSPTLPRRGATSRSDDALSFVCEVYQDLLRLLTLTHTDREGLLARGLDQEAIRLADYRSLAFPALARAEAFLRAKYRDRLLEVPGFSADGQELKMYPRHGLLVPVRDSQGRPVAFQVRLGEKNAKYRWLSTRDSPSGSPCHHSLLGGPWTDEWSEVWITEGPLKADVVSFYRDSPTLGCGGAGAAARVCEALEGRRGVTTVLAFDMDRLSKEGVTLREKALAQALRGRGHKVRLASWDASHNGLDDALHAGVTVSVQDYPFEEGPQILTALGDLEVGGRFRFPSESAEYRVCQGSGLAVLPDSGMRACVRLGDWRVEYYPIDVQVERCDDA